MKLQLWLIWSILLYRIIIINNNIIMSYNNP